MRRLWGVLVLVAAAGVAAALSGSARSAWPGYNGQILFETTGQDLGQVYPDGSGFVRSTLWDFYLGYPEDLAWSRDGKWVAFEAPWGDGYNQPEIWIGGMEPGALTTLEQWAGPDDLGRDFDPAWSPDGTSLMFICQRNTDNPASTVPTGICRAPFEESAPATLVIPGTFDALAWSPDGKRIAYSSTSGLFVANANGSSARRISTQPLDALDWSPDDTTVAGQAAGPELYTVDVTTGTTTDLGPGREPAWSPDGKSLVFGTDNDEFVNYALAIEAADGSDRHVIIDQATGNPISGGAAAWLPGNPRQKPNPPVIAGRPAISGTAKENAALEATPGSWNGDPPLTYTYAWQRCDVNGNACEWIAGATTPSYVVVASDVGHTLRVDVGAANAAGQASAGSDATAVVVPANEPPTIAHAHAHRTGEFIRLALTVCDDSADPVSVEATDSTVAHGKNVKTRNASWSIAGVTGCRQAVESWRIPRTPAARQVISLRAADARGAASATVRLTLP